MRKGKVIDMSIMDKIMNAKTTYWLTEGMSEAEIKTTVELAKISAQIEKCRIERKMTQKEFAEYMGVNQSMISKWESREYNFTIRSLNEICQKLGLSLSVNLEKKYTPKDYTVIRWNNENFANSQNSRLDLDKYMKATEAIA